MGLKGIDAPRPPRELGHLPRRVAGACIKPHISVARREAEEGAVGRGCLRPAPYGREPGVLVPGVAIAPAEPQLTCSASAGWAHGQGVGWAEGGRPKALPTVRHRSRCEQIPQIPALAGIKATGKGKGRRSFSQVLTRFIWGPELKILRGALVCWGEGVRGREA